MKENEPPASGAAEPAPGYLVKIDQVALEHFRQATVVANICKEIVLKTTKKIGFKNYVKVEGWTSIAVAHGCVASIEPGSVREILREGHVVGFEAVAEIRRQSDGVVLSEAVGYVGDDEMVWFGSKGVAVERWNDSKKKKEMVVIPKRADYAIRAMAQTRAISRVCRSAFSHVVVLMNAGLSTVPAEEVEGPEDFTDVEAREADAAAGERRAEPAADSGPPPATNAGKAATNTGAEKSTAPAAEKKPAAEAKRPVEVPRDPSVEFQKQFVDGAWKKVKVHFGTNNGKKLEDLTDNQLRWYAYDWSGGGRAATEKFAAKPPTEDDKILRAAAVVAAAELGLEPRASS
jgi:hypothetical protein